jgi:hypothetical protein
MQAVSDKNNENVRLKYYAEPQGFGAPKNDLYYLV